MKNKEEPKDLLAELEMLQRVLDFYQPLTGRSRESVDALLQAVGGREAMQINLSRRVKREKNILVAEG